MDGSRFDALSRACGHSSSRRGLTRLLSGLAVSGPVALFGLSAQAKHKRKKKHQAPPAPPPSPSPCPSPPPPPPPPGCVPTCGASTACGPDGCGGSCGSCTGHDTCQNGQCVCVPQCTGKTCGPDGCEGSCGSCTGGTCRQGTCDCSGGSKEYCGGACVAACSASQRRNPIDCTCCVANGSSVGVCDPLTNGCCSGLCADNGTCLGGFSGLPCQFDAQCESSACTANGTCA